MTSEATILRRNFARYLVPAYLKNPTHIAELCDEMLDRTGTLLGYLREEARREDSKEMG